MKAIFIRKACDINQLIEDTKTIREWGKEGSEYSIVKTIMLTAEEFKLFENDLLDNYDFIRDNNEEIRVSDSIFYVLKVKSPNKGYSILVDSEGYDYARYTAIIYN